MTHGKHRRKRRHEPEEHSEMLGSIYAIGKKRYGRRLAHSIEMYLRIIAAWAKPLVEERNNQNQKKRQDHPCERIALETLPYASARLSGALSAMTLRKANHKLKKYRKHPRHRGKERRRHRASVKPREN